MEQEISNNYNGRDSAWLLESLGFTIIDKSINGYDVAMTNLGIRLSKVAHCVIVPSKWRVEKRGFSTVFYGPNGERLWSFIKRDPHDRCSRLEVSGV